MEMKTDDKCHLCEKVDDKHSIRALHDRIRRVTLIDVGVRVVVLKES